MGPYALLTMPGAADAVHREPLRRRAEVTYLVGGKEVERGR